MTDEWEYAGFSFDSKRFVLNGIDVWALEWIATDERVRVKDPRYGQDFEFEIWIIDIGNERIEFAAGEFSNCCWGFYTRRSSNR